MIGKFVKSKITSSPINIVSVRDSNQLRRLFVNKTEQNPPVARYTERQKTYQWCRKALRMQQRIIRIVLQTLNKCREFLALGRRQKSSTFEKIRVIDDFNHCALSSHRREKSSHSRNGGSDVQLQHATIFSQKQDCTHLQRLVPQYLRQKSAEGLFRVPNMQWSCDNNIPTNRKINEDNRGARFKQGSTLLRNAPQRRRAGGKYFLILIFLIVGAAAAPTHALAAGCSGTGECYWVGGTGSWSDPSTTNSLHSFGYGAGTIKWATATGGGMFSIR